jgi:hypothetical protein
MSEQTVEQVDGAEPESAPEEPKPAKKSSLEEAQETFPVYTRVVFEKSDDKGKAGVVTGHTEKFGVGYLEVDVELLSGKTRQTVTRTTSVRAETAADVAEREQAATEREAARKAKEEKAKAAAEAEATVDASESAAGNTTPEVPAESADVAEETPKRRRRGRS